MKLLMLILGRTAFVGLLVFLVLFGVASLIGYPGPFVLTAFSLGGSMAWFFDRRVQWLAALLLAATASALPVFLLFMYAGDGDFSYPSAAAQSCVLALLAYGFALAGIEAGRAVWLPRGHSA